MLPLMPNSGLAMQQESVLKEDHIELIALVPRTSTQPRSDAQAQGSVLPTKYAKAIPAASYI